MCYGQLGESEYSNYCAVGMFTPGIEIWNLDVINPLEPKLILGGDAPVSSKKKKKITRLHEGSHTGMIYCMIFQYLT